MFGKLSKFSLISLSWKTLPFRYVSPLFFLILSEHQTISRHIGLDSLLSRIILERRKRSYWAIWPISVVFGSMAFRDISKLELFENISLSFLFVLEVDCFLLYFLQLLFFFLNLLPVKIIDIVELDLMTPFWADFTLEGTSEGSRKFLRVFKLFFENSNGVIKLSAVML